MDSWSQRADEVIATENMEGGEKGVNEGGFGTDLSEEYISKKRSTENTHVLGGKSFYLLIVHN